MADVSGSDLTVPAQATTTASHGLLLAPAPNDAGALTPSLTRESTHQSARRSLASDRISEILKTSRERAEALETANSTTAPGPAGQRSSNMSTRRHAGAVRDGGESSADETTGMVMRGPDRNYQTTSNPAPSTVGPSRVSTRAEEGTPVASASSVVRARIQRFLSHFQSIELENKGSVARDHLAIERTFLAWLRTSLAFASIGIAVTQLFRLNTALSNNSSTANNDNKTLRQLGKPLGATFLAISILVLLLGYRRYVESQQWVMRGKFPASRGTVILVSAVAFALMIASLVVVIIVHPGETER